jgi:hypothetical protein
MPASKPPIRKKKSSAARRSVSTTKQPAPLTFRQRVIRRYQTLRARQRAFLARRPHRSFRRTLRRDYARSLRLPGYHAFTLQVYRELRAHKKTFLLLVIGYGLATVILGGVTSQATYAQINELLQDSASTLDADGWGQVGRAGLLLLATFASGPGNLTADQQVYLAIILLFVWLSTVWLLREFKLGRKPVLRDALYNSGAPFISTLLLLVVLVCQLLPIGIVALVYAALSSVGIVGEGFGSMLFWACAAVVAALVLYWVTSTVIALVVVTLPGMYPLRAMKAAGDLVVGRRLRIMYRILWALGTVGLAWVVVMLPLVLLTTWLTSMWAWVANVPILPIVAALLSALSVVWVSAYVYTLYRKVVDDGAAPA